ncbi:4Fe-4S dicluster domain-containing protein [Pseudodesulfovibrio pelocollis]|uniref:4Fe-4S dicluster domain-containing protein n=1 Tax=Pseudodesulfovibrio pelocollis TaxID=3051432 RepID=UPI00255A8062|nr:4Fe-4S dicluster domain-containing protein [Pseudodesulfovibrio sp. SB368]
MTKWAMVIDQQKCVGCGACIIACKNENNLSEGVNWSYKLTETVGVFPHVRYHYTPTLCNHCENAPCVRGCPTRAMYKLDNGITMHDPKKCIGCRYCIANCPYGVIFYNWRRPNEQWENKDVLIPGCTSSPAEMVEKTGGSCSPYSNPERGTTLPESRPLGVVEKCTFCDHRVVRGLLPYCVEACPADARIFGDLDDPDSTVSKLLGKFKPRRLREHLGTEPHVFYIRSFNPGSYTQSKGEIS